MLSHESIGGISSLPLLGSTIKHWTIHRPMIVSANKPFQLVYALFQHQYLGFLFESFVIQLNEDRKMTLQYQNISAQNASEFATGMAERDYKIIGLMDSIQPTVIANRFSTKKMKPDDFFLKVYDTDTGDKKLQETIHQMVPFPGK